MTTKTVPRGTKKAGSPTVAVVVSVVVIAVRKYTSAYDSTYHSYIVTILSLQPRNLSAIHVWIEVVSTLVKIMVERSSHYNQHYGWQNEHE